MLFRTAMVAAAAALFANAAIGSPLEGRGADAALIATNPVAACNCPNNCSYKQGHSCKYKDGPSTNSPTVSGTCDDRGGTLTCIRNG